MTETTLSLAKKLISIESVTPVDGGCQDIMSQFLSRLGFQISPMPFEEVTNFWATYRAEDSHENDPVFLFAGHTDVVPPGEISQWQTPPFEAVEKNGELHGRGAADMKSALASMLIATEKFLQANTAFKGTIAFLITSDEEGPFINGTKRVIETLKQQNQQIDYCVIGEPSCIDNIGDRIRIGRRGSLSGHLQVHGIQGHVAYPEITINAVHKSLDVLNKLVQVEWDQGNDQFPPTSFQISRYHAGSAGNIVPGLANIHFNFRFSNEQNFESLQSSVVDMLNLSGIDYSLDWIYNGMPYLTQQGKLIAAAESAIAKVSKLKPMLSTGGGTSDGRFIATTGAEVIELGHCCETIHKVNEKVNIEHLDLLTECYFEILNQIFA